MPSNTQCECADWQIRPLGEIAEIILGGTPSTDVPAYWGGSIPWMSSGEVNKKRVFEADGRITEAGLAASNATLVDPPSVAIGLAGQGKTRGTAALVNTRLCTNQSIALIKGRTGVLDTGYLFHNLDGRYDELRTRSAGGGRAGLSREILAEVPIALPDLLEQTRIAEVMDTLDETIAKTAAVLAKLEKARAGLLHDILTRGLDKDGQPRNSIAHPEQFQDSPFGRIPRDWVVAPLGYFIESAEYGISTTLSSDGSLPVLRMNNLAAGEATLDEVKFATCEVPKSLLLRVGDVLFNRTNSYEHVGRTGIWRGQLPVATFASYLVRLNPVPSRLSSEYLNLVLNMPESQQRMRRYATPAVQQVNINPTSLQLMPVAIPKLVTEQERISTIANESVHTVEAEEQELAKLVALKSGLMNDLLNGRVRVPANKGGCA